MRDWFPCKGIKKIAPSRPIERQNGKGKSTFENVSKDLLYVDYCTLCDTDELSTMFGERLDFHQIPLFSDVTLGYLWDYDNYGLKVAQLRFYEVPAETDWAVTDGGLDQQ